MVSVPSIEEDGSFEHFLIEGYGGACACVLDLFIPDSPGPTRPDQVEIIVVRDDCEQIFRIDLTADTVVDLDFPNDVIELRDPIIVEPCED